MTSRSEIIDVTKSVLSQMTREEAEDIELPDRLNEDLGLDSMDAVDLVVDLKMELGVKFGSDDVEAVQTVSDIVERIQDKLDGSV
jgi:acyl carrier protein